MATIAEIIEDIRQKIKIIPAQPIDELMTLINPITIGLTQSMPVAFAGTRMFRVRTTKAKPTHIDKVGAPPVGKAGRGRLNEEGTSVLYLSDTPSTAFSEAGAEECECCISEWKVDCEKLGLVNGGLTKQLLADNFSKHISDFPAPEPTEQDELVMELFRDVFTLDVDDEVERYAWSIASGRASGFNHKSGLIEKIEKDGMTTIKGEMPFSALIYPSVRSDKLSLNFAVNHQGMEHISLQHVQWVKRLNDGRTQSLDIATSWSKDGELNWEGRPARFVLKQGEEAKVIKIGENEWDYETKDGTVPWYS